jgi:superfamily II DNA or RNA helicase
MRKALGMSSHVDDASVPALVEHDGRTCAVLRVVDDFGQKALDLIGAPRRCIELDDREPLYVQNIDYRHVRQASSPAETLAALEQTEPWMSLTARAQAKLLSAFLLGEDPQRRLDAQKAAALMHQMSLVQHVLSSDGLRRVLIADEVGLGKTIEAGFIIRRVLEQLPRARVLYLSPARLVGNVVAEFRDKLDLDARRWVAGGQGDARLDGDRLVVASINRAVFGENRELMQSSGPWNVVIVDECHHLSDWGAGGGKPNQSYKLAEALASSLGRDGRLILLSGTPHQGSLNRFENLVRLLADDGKNVAQAAGRVIYRTKDRVRDWRGRPLFPRRDIRSSTVVSLGRGFHAWYEAIADLYDRPGATGSLGRAAGWAKGQALQWASSSIEAGVGYLARLAIRRLNWTTAQPELARALSALRPYRGGSTDEPVDDLFRRIRRDLQPQIGSLEDQEETEEQEVWRPDPMALSEVLNQGIALLGHQDSLKKWEELISLLERSGGEKVVLFAQPVETVTVVLRQLEQRYGVRPAVIMGNQSDDERAAEVKRFRRPDGPRFLVSSRAGGEGLNLQVSRRLIHLDVPWNPMELEQRIGRVHRFGSRKTVVVDTLIVDGTREVDMYRIAREKLRLIATQLDPEQFEILFSRVMSLVPPKELESVLGNAAATRVEGEAAEAIGALVRQGYAIWEEFDRRFRNQAEKISSLQPGEASWNDLHEFLVRTANARPAPEVTLTTFELEGDEVVDREEQAPALRVGESVYVCADTGGSPAQTDNGDAVATIGLNHPWVREQLYRSLMLPGAGAGYVNRPSTLGPDFPQRFGVLAFLRHAVRFAPGETSERAVTYHVFTVNDAQQIAELKPSDAARLTRALYTAVRVRDPEVTPLARGLRDRERELANRLRAVSDEERSQDVRPAVWPVGAFVVSG